jgi:hypothetical protein
VLTQRKSTYNVILRRVSVTFFCGKAVCYIFCVSIALVTQHSKRTNRIILSSVACPAVQYFNTLSHKRHDYRENEICWTHNVCKLYVCLSVQRCIRVEKKTQLDATEWLIALIICWTCFGHLYAHHQEFETLCVSLPPLVCSALIAGGRRWGAG